MTDSDKNNSSSITTDRDIVWPRKAVVTAGMPYGNKPLHFGHIGGVFVPADAYARFLRDRIGSQNVRFVSGTDCFGSPIDEGYRKAVNDGFKGSISDYVMRNHEMQTKVLEQFDISLDIFEGSGIGHAGEVHQDLTYSLVTGLYEKKHLNLVETMQFFDEQAVMFLNGRQVLGRCCPVQGCKAEHAYADECDLGHQYDPTELSSPVSTVTGTVPVMRPVKNWYFDLPAFRDFLKRHIESLRGDERIRDIVSRNTEEFLCAPVIFVKNDFVDQYESIASELPDHTFREAQKGKASFELEFSSIEDRDQARSILENARIRFRTSKALVPFRITGNVEWGLRAPVLDGVEGLTIWCWPESLWAPISFTIAANDERGLPRESWRDFWCSDSSGVFQFIGEDNLYFYGVAQPAIFEALGDRGVFGGEGSRRLRQTTLVANHHLLFGNKKASSSGDVKPPTGEELLEHYTADELRAHFLALGLDQRSVKFAPKPFDPSLSEEERADSRRADPVLKEGALLSNIFNRFARSCFYEAQNNFDAFMPLGEPSAEVTDAAVQKMSAFEDQMHRIDLHSAFTTAEELVRYSNKYWSSGISAIVDEEKSLAENASNEHIGKGGMPISNPDDPNGIGGGLLLKDRRRQLLVDCFYLLRICTLLMHPFVPRGCESICSYLDFDPSDFFSWNYDFDGNGELCQASEIDDGIHQLCRLPKRFDFFPKHPSRFKK